MGKLDAAEVRGLFPVMTDAVEVWLKEGAEKAMSRFNGEGKKKD